jgi:hypothetical protein
LQHVRLHPGQQCWWGLEYNTGCSRPYHQIVRAPTWTTHYTNTLFNADKWQHYLNHITLCLFSIQLMVMHFYTTIYYLISKYYGLVGYWNNITDTKHDFTVQIQWPNVVIIISF